MQKSLILFIILIIVITIAALTETKLESEKNTPFLAQTSSSNNLVAK